MNLFIKTVSLGYILCGCLSISGALAAELPDGHQYKVTVFSSFGSQFNDCFTFDRSGNLQVAGYGPLIYRHGQLNGQIKSWDAIPVSPVYGFTLSFHGSVGGAAGQTIVANGISSEGSTFILQGVLNSSCAASVARQPAGSAWKHP